MMHTSALTIGSIETLPSTSIAGHDAPSITIPDAHFLFHADFKRAGSDLTLTGEDGHRTIIPDYFKNEILATLRSPEGAMLTGDVIEALAGSVAPGQYAQAGTPVQTSPLAIGRVASVQGGATAFRNGVPVALNTGDVVLKGDVIQTAGNDSAVGIVFSDGSTFSLSANARMVLNEFVYSPGGSANSAMINLVQGSITFIAGQVAHTGDMRVGTPVASLGIRGTAVNVTIQADNGATGVSVMAQGDNLLHTVQVWALPTPVDIAAGRTVGALLGTVTNNSGIFTFTPTPTGVLVQETGKDAATVQAELALVQAAFQTQTVGETILAQQPLPNSTGNAAGTQITTGPPTDVSTTNIVVTVSNTPTGPTVTDVQVNTPPPGTPPTIPLVQPGDPSFVQPAASADALAVTEGQIEIATASTQLLLGNLLGNDAGTAIHVASITAPTLNESKSGFFVISILAEVALGNEVARYDIKTNYGDAHIAVGIDGKVYMWSDNGENPFRGLDVGDTATINFTYTVDNNNGGTDTANVSIAINGSNDVPVIHTPDCGIQYWASNTRGDVTPINHISFDDSDAGCTQVLVNFSMNDHGDSLTAHNLCDSGVTVVSGDGTWNIRLQGTIADINAYLYGNNLAWNPYGHHDHEPGLLTVKIDDNGSDPGGNVVSTTVWISEIGTPCFTSGNDTVDLSGVNISDVCLVDAGCGNDTVTTAWTHSGDATTYDGGDGCDTIHLVFTPDQLSEILANTTMRDCLTSFLNDPDGKTLNLSNSSWNAKAEGFEHADLNLVSGDGSGLVFNVNGLVQADRNDGFIVAPDNCNTELSAPDCHDYVLVGRAGDDRLVGNTGNDCLLGGAGDDTLIGGLGNDILSGSTGRDTFSFREMCGSEANFGKDIVVDFHAGEDFIEFDQAMFADRADLLAHITEVDGNAVIDAGNCNTVTLAGVSMNTLIAHQTDIHLVVGII